MSTKHIKIISCGNNYLQVIRSIRQITGLGLKDAMDLADNLPIDLFATDQQITDFKNAAHLGVLFKRSLTLCLSKIP